MFFKIKEYIIATIKIRNEDEISIMEVNNIIVKFIKLEEYKFYKKVIIIIKKIELGKAKDKKKIYV